MPNILVIDDDVIMLKTIQYMLNKDGFNVVTATDGTEALDLLNQSVFDLVITDMRMPRMQGMEVISRLRNNTKNKNLGIIIVSNITNKDTMADALQLGADCFLNKPVAVEELRSSIMWLLEAR